MVVTSYGMLLRAAVALGRALAAGRARRGPGDQEPRRRQTKTVKRLQCRRADRADRHAGGEPPVGPLVAVRFSLSRPAGIASQVQAVRQAAWTQREQNRYAPLRSLVQPYILRRLKTDRRIIDDLPEKTEVRAFCGLSKRQAALYAKLVEELADLLEELPTACSGAAWCWPT